METPDFEIIQANSFCGFLSVTNHHFPANIHHINGLVQTGSDSIANALE